MRDLGLLSSALDRPRTTLYGRDAYPGLPRKAAALVDSVVRNHSLVDGNRRLGWMCLVVLLDLNGIRLEVDDDEAFDLVMGVAGGTVPLDDLDRTIARWIAAG